MAKEQKPAQKTEVVPDAPVTPPPPRSFRLYITLGFSGLILCQLIVLWLLLPSRNVAQEHAGNNPPPSDAPSSEPMVEMPLQKDPFKVKQLRGEDLENLTLRVFVLVKKKESSKFTKQYEQYMQRVIDRVGDVLYASSRAEREERGLNAIKEKTKQGINEALGTPMVQQVLISDYSFSVE